MAAHTQSESLLQRSPRPPAPASPPARHTQTAPVLGGTQRTAESQHGAARVAAFELTRVPYAALDGAGHALAAQLAELTHHAQGLKAYFFVAPGTRPLLAGHAAVDVEAFAGQRARAPGGGGTPTEPASHSQMNRALLMPAYKRQPEAGEPPAKELAKALLGAGALIGKVPQPMNGKPTMQGGTRLCRTEGVPHVLVEESGQYGYVDGGPEVTEALANFYANALLAAAAAARDTPPRVQPKPCTADLGELRKEDVNAGLGALAAAINAKLDAHVPRG